jgi:YD repeat-containing protein
VTGITYPSSATNSFVYNGEDLRVSKTDSAGTSAQITDGTSPASPVLKDARAVYTPGISERAGTTSKFYHGDALGSTRGITNSSQTVTDVKFRPIWSRSFRPRSSSRGRLVEDFALEQSTRVMCRKGERTRNLSSHFSAKVDQRAHSLPGW